MKLESISGRRPFSKRAWAASLLVHGVALAALLWRPAPAYISPEVSLRGSGGATPITFAAPGVSAPAIPQRERPAKDVLALRRSHAAAQRPAESAAQSHDGLKPGMPGYILGSLTSGFVRDHDVRAAYSVVHPDPPINRAKLPPQLVGDVIIEVTIDAKGSVTETRLLQAMGFGIDDILLTTVRHWQFAPARVDGIAVASRNDVHFHFPS